MFITVLRTLSIRFSPSTSRCKQFQKKKKNSRNAQRSTPLLLHTSQRRRRRDSSWRTRRRPPATSHPDTRLPPVGIDFNGDRTLGTASPPPIACEEAGGSGSEMFRSVASPGMGELMKLSKPVIAGIARSQDNGPGRGKQLKHVS